MTDHIFNFSKPFLSKKRSAYVPLVVVGDVKKWLGKQDALVKAAAADRAFGANGWKILPVRDKNGAVEAIYVALDAPFKLYDFAKIHGALSTTFSKDFLKKTSFELDVTGLEAADIQTACIGWALGGYEFTAYKASGKELPKLVLPSGADKAQIEARAHAIYLVRNLITTPANDMGPDALEKAAAHIAKEFKADINVIRGEDLLKQNFPLVHLVGKANDRAPRLIDLTWGKAKDPKITIVGKGVAFDTGGLNIKPGSSMALMKKDMGGAAHALGLAYAIMSLKLPVRLRVVIPAVENSISANAFRPSDVSPSRKGLTVENTNTDAEGRLILADALTYACEDKPELVVDFATLTGSARAALGQEIPAMFSNNDDVGETLEKISMRNEDPLWRMPLWQNYNRHNKSSIADIHNSAGLPGDLMYSALFLESFLINDTKWVHIDTFAWEPNGKPGCPKGGTDMGMRAVLAYLEETYT